MTIGAFTLVLSCSLRDQAGQLMDISPVPCHDRGKACVACEVSHTVGMIEAPAKLQRFQGKLALYGGKQSCFSTKPRLAGWDWKQILTSYLWPQKCLRAQRL